MKSRFTAAIAVIALPCLFYMPMGLRAQTPTMDAINFKGATNVFNIHHGTGAPTSSCTGTTQYVQDDDTTGNPMWVCKNGTMVHLSGIPTLTANQGVAANGSGVLSTTPEKGYSTASSVTSVAWDEDYSQGRFDCRNTKYAGGCLGGTPGAAMQAFSDALVCYQAISGNHARVTFPPGTIAVGTATYPTLKLPTGAIYMGGGGWGFATNATQFQATYNGHGAVEFDNNLTSTTNCSDGNPHTSTLAGGSYDGFSEHGCGQGGCVNVPGDSNNYPFGGPQQTGITITDADATMGKAAGLFASANGADGIIISGQDSHTYEVGGSDNNAYFYFGIDTAGQNYQFSGLQECHGEIDLGGLDNMNEGPNEAYGTFMTLGWEYGHIAGICLGGGNVSMGTYFSQIEEIGILFAGDGGTQRVRVQPGRIDAPRGDGIRTINGGHSTFVNPVVISACRADGLNDFLVYSVAVATPGSGQTPGTYLLTGSDGHTQISVTVAAGGTVTATPIVTVHYRGMTNTPPTYTLAAGGTPATFTVTMKNVFDLSGLSDVTAGICDYFSDRAGLDTYVSPLAVNDGFFGASHATGDIYFNSSALRNTWISARGNGSSSSPIWDPQPVSISRAQGQVVIDSDIVNGAGTPVAGSSLDLSVTGGHIQWANTSATTITAISNGYMGQDLWMHGDGFTTMPYIPNASITFMGVGAINCSGYPLLLEANRLYHYQLVGGQQYGFPIVLAEICDSINQNFWWVNHAANSASLPSLEQQGQVDSIGDIRSHALPALAAITGQSGGTPGPNGVGGTFTYAYRVWGPWGTQTWGALTFSQCLPLPGFVNNPCYQTLTWTLPEGTTHVQVFRETSTDTVATAGMIFEQTWTTPQHTTQQTFPDTRVAPINGNTIGSANYNANVTGGMAGKCGSIPSSSNYPGVQGQMCDDPAGGYRYWADADDHWQRTPTTYANF